jgi:uncharacterized membrane protein YkoI
MAIRRNRWRSLLAVVLLSALSANAAFAHDEDHDQAIKLRNAGEIQSLETIVDKARQLHPGHIIESELEHDGRLYVYEIELVDEHGTIWNLKFNAQTGELITDNQGH